LKKKRFERVEPQSHRDTEKIRNPKSEIRNPKKGGSDFGFKISDFLLCASVVSCSAPPLAQRKIPIVLRHYRSAPSMPTKTVSPCLAAALEYLARGWSAIPLCPPDHAGCSPAHVAGCKSAGKAPLWPWKTYQERLPSERELRIYWSRNIHCNVGVVLGSVSGLVGVDADGPDADAILRELSLGD
jgi:hypothetical protein